MTRRPTPQGRQSLRARYGASPLHLILLIASFALAGFAALSLVKSQPIMVIIWFVGAAVGHDIVLLPLYGLLDRAVAGRIPRREQAANAVNYIRVPGGISLILLLIYLPSIARLSPSYTKLTDLSSSGYFLRWLAVTGALFVISGLIFVIRIGRGSRSGQEG